MKTLRHSLISAGAILRRNASEDIGAGARAYQPPAPPFRGHWRQKIAASYLKERISPFSRSFDGALTRNSRGR
jgi:hypothetical protein